MSEGAHPLAVFDCTVFAQALINPNGPAGACLISAQARRIRLIVSDYVLYEIRQLPTKIPVKFGVTADRVERLIRDLAKYADLIEHVPTVFKYNRDPDDEHYVNLAIGTGGSYLIVSRDKDLLDLMDDVSDEGRILRNSHPTFCVLSPPAFLQSLTAR